MPARRLINTALRQWTSSSVAHRFSTLQKWCPVPRASPTRACQVYVAHLTTQRQYQKRRIRFDQEDGGKPPFSWRKPSVDESLYRRLKNPKRKKKTFTPELSKGSKDHSTDLGSPKSKAYWEVKQTKELEDRLQRIARYSPSVNVVYRLLRALIVHRSGTPTVSHYEALILSNCDAELGSTQAVKAVLQEMEREQIAIGTSIYEAVLKVLAVHPDHLLRLSILDSMAKQWISLTPSMEHFLIAGYIRDGQLELALQGIGKMQQQKAPVPRWLYSLMIYSLCEAEDFDAVLRSLYSAEDERVEIPTYTLHHVLDQASECLHLDLTKRIWRDMVEPTYINPATGICYNVLLTAARAGDKALAESVVELLAHRQPKPSDLEYDLLEEAYVKAGDEEGAKKIRLRREEPDSVERTVSPSERPSWPTDEAGPGKVQFSTGGKT